MLLHIARVIFILLEVLILFNLLIVVHELGHFLAARWRGLYIEKFGVWFGKPLWKKTINGVQYSLGSLPFGGFVALPQLAPMDIIEGKADVDRANLPKISAPVLGIYPAAGVITKDEHTDLLREKIRNLTMIRIPLNAHSLQIVAPAMCAQEVLHFIARHDGIPCRE